ncbi:DUF5133 domain-containing protein [Streptomyces sp. NPDC020607]|uniref:DUF5133 domain-containing protein n=1 Tax=Streptomyces sp. NPDC020607 TaxID=3365082 RepID=UPI0037AC61BD
MVVPAENTLRTVLARFAQARIDHDIRPTGATSRALEDVSYTLCVMTDCQDIGQALEAADSLLAAGNNRRPSAGQGDKALAA